MVLFRIIMFVFYGSIIMFVFYGSMMMCCYVLCLAPSPAAASCGAGAAWCCLVLLALLTLLHVTAV